MSLVSEMIAQLLAAPTPFAMVEGAGSLAQVTDQPNAVPAAFIFIKEEVSDENSRMTGGHLQVTEADVAVAIATQNVSGDNGEAGAADIENLKAFVRSRLIGWKPSASENPISHMAGKMVSVRGGTVWFEDTFAATTFLEASS